MLMNPYKVSVSATAKPAMRRAVNRYILGAALAVLTLIPVSILAIVLLNQEWGIVPMQMGLIDIELGGRSVSAHSVMVASLVFCAFLLGAACLFLLLAYRNRHS